MVIFILIAVFFNSAFLKISNIKKIKTSLVKEKNYPEKSIQIFITLLIAIEISSIFLLFKKTRIYESYLLLIYLIAESFLALRFYLKHTKFHLYFFNNNPVSLKEFLSLLIFLVFVLYLIKNEKNNKLAL